ncbi:MAG: hypothetical protein ACK5KO_09265 [Arachnia sp.]
MSMRGATRFLASSKDGDAAPSIEQFPTGLRRPGTGARDLAGLTVQRLADAGCPGVPQLSRGRT